MHGPDGQAEKRLTRLSSRPERYSGPSIVDKDRNKMLLKRPPLRAPPGGRFGPRRYADTWDNPRASHV